MVLVLTYVQQGMAELGVCILSQVWLFIYHTGEVCFHSRAKRTHLPLADALSCGPLCNRNHIE